MMSNTLPIYTSRVGFIRGRGIGNVLSRFFQTIIPVFSKPAVKQGLKAVGKSVLQSGLDATQAALSGQEGFVPALKRSGKREFSKLIGQATTGITTPPTVISNQNTAKRQRLARVGVPPIPSRLIIKKKKGRKILSRPGKKKTSTRTAVFKTRQGDIFSS